MKTPLPPGIADSETVPIPAPLGTGALTLTEESARYIREEIERASGREVCFLARIEARSVTEVRAVARGNRAAVLAAAKDATPGSLMIHNHPNGSLEPSGADLSVAAQLYEEGIGTAITDNRASRLYVVVEPPTPRVVENLDDDALADLLGPDGPLASIHRGYEDRPAQQAMLRFAAERYNGGGIGLVEAGTGTGKSIAYLIPAVRWALQNEERTVISTNTIHLQEQLVTKDLPIVRQMLGDEVEWALVKGRGNYISIRRAGLALTGGESLFEQDRTDELDSIRRWMGSTDDGSLSDLTFTPTDEVWEEVRSDPDICLRAKCPHFKECFYQRSRRRAAAARILIVNHHLLFTDLAVRRVTQNYTGSAVLPAYKRLILDEAHNIEDAATSHLGVRVSRAGMFRTLARLDRGGKGVLSAVYEALRTGPWEGTEDLRRLIETRIRREVETVRAQISLLLDRVQEFAGERSADTLRVGIEGEADLTERPALRERLAGTIGAFSALIRLVRSLADTLESRDDWAEALAGRILDLRALERRLASTRDGLELVLGSGAEAAPRYVRWIEGLSRGANPIFSAAPIELAPILRSDLFEKMETALLSSATLTVRGRFDFMRDRLGLVNDESVDMELPVYELDVPSPFDFEEQSLLCVPTDLPGAEGEPEPFHGATARVVTSMAQITGGGIFVLFTSYSALRRTAALLRADDVERRWPLFVHGESDRARLLDGFMKSGNAILLGTTSFWEGVDVPGRPLRGLVIQRIPFKVPTDPVTAARVEALEKRGGSAFWDFMVPHAALRLKQGFGRLLRSRTDFGAVVLLDDRILRKRYGRILRASLPPAPLIKGSWPELEVRLRTRYRLWNS